MGSSNHIHIPTYLGTIIVSSKVVQIRAIRHLRQLWRYVTAASSDKFLGTAIGTRCWRWSIWTHIHEHLNHRDTAAAGNFHYKASTDDNIVLIRSMISEQDEAGFEPDVVREKPPGIEQCTSHTNGSPHGHGRWLVNSLSTQQPQGEDIHSLVRNDTFVTHCGR
jgi:hypothetical protein